jgi:hypothetical protein
VTLKLGTFELLKSISRGRGYEYYKIYKGCD